jgi:hypothetical protein
LRAREQKLINNKSLGIQAEDGFVKMFKSSHSISLSIGKIFLARKSKSEFSNSSNDDKHGEGAKESEKVKDLI